MNLILSMRQWHFICTCMNAESIAVIVMGNKCSYMIILFIPWMHGLSYMVNFEDMYTSSSLSIYWKTFNGNTWKSLILLSFSEKTSHYICTLRRQKKNLTLGRRTSIQSQTINLWDLCYLIAEQGNVFLWILKDLIQLANYK